MLALACALAALAAGADPSPAGEGPAPRLPGGPLELSGRPLRIAALPPRDGALEIVLLREREVERLRLSGRELRRTGSFRAPVKRARPLHLDAAPAPGGNPAVVAALFGEDVQSVDEGTDTALHAWVLAASEDGDFRAASDDLEAYVRVVDGKIRLQRRGRHELQWGPVLSVEERAGRYAATEGALPWGSRWLLEATPLPGGEDALAWEDGKPFLVSRDDGARRPGGGLLGGLGSVREPSLAVRLERPLFRMGLDKEGRVSDTWHPLPRRVAISSDGGIYTIDRGRSKGLPLLGRTSGQDSVVRLDVSEGALSLSRPFEGVEAYVLDFALVERPGAPPAALLLVNDESDGSGRAHLVAREPR